MYFISRGLSWTKEKRFVLGVVIIAVYRFIRRLDDHFLLDRASGRQTTSENFACLPDNLYNAFALPDLVLAAFLLIASVGLSSLQKNRLCLALMASAWWLFDSLLASGLTGFFKFGLALPQFVFCLWSIYYLWKIAGKFFSSFCLMLMS
jgi:hypothetical protein